MKAIAFLSQKGGSKTTLAVHIAVAAQEAGERVVVVDTDMQKSATAWSQSRQDAIPPVVTVAPTSLSDVMRAARHDAMTLCIIDTAPHAASDAARVAKRNKWPAPFLTFRAPRRSSFPPLTSLSGQSARHETKCATGWPHVSYLLLFIIVCGFRLNWEGDEISEGAGMPTARQERATIQSPIPLKPAWNATSARGSHLSP